MRLRRSCGSGEWSRPPPGRPTVDLSSRRLVYNEYGWRLSRTFKKLPSSPRIGVASTDPDRHPSSRRRSRPCEHRARGYEREDGGRSTRRGPRETVQCASLAVLGRVQSPSSIQFRITRRRGRCSTRQCGTCAKSASFHLLSLLLLLLLLLPAVYGHAMCGQGYQHA